jgi:type I restriction enzyme, S subunit
MNSCHRLQTGGDYVEKSHEFDQNTESARTSLQWLNHIPASWQIVRLDSVFELVRRTIRQTEMAGKTVFHYSIPSIQDTGDGQIESGDEINSDKLLLSGGELIVSKLNPRKATVLLTKAQELPIVASTEFVALRPKAIHSRFALYLYLSHWVREKISSVVQSATKSHQRANPSEIYKLWAPLPSLDEQAYIASFLDRETAKLDVLVEKKQRIIELLQEKRQALITQAVTTGLDPHVSMKDSGIPSLGKVPTHWDVVKTSRVTISIQTGPFGSQLHAQDYVDNGIPVINPSHLTNGLIVPDRSSAVSQETKERLLRHELLCGDIVFARRGEIGRCALVTETSQGFLCGTGCFRVRPNVGVVDERFMAISFSTPWIRDWLLLHSVGSTMDNLNTAILANTPLLLPPVPEQRSIVQQVSKISESIELAIAKMDQQVELLREYRQALIFAAVTGQIDVRKYVGNEAEAIAQ